MNTRFSPSLNGSLHLGHLYMCWVNRTIAHMHGGKFILRFDDLAPRAAGENIDQMPRWATEAESMLRQAGLDPDGVSFLSDYVEVDEGFFNRVGGRNQWLRAPNLEGHFDLVCVPDLVQARVRADIAEHIDVVIRGEELLPELQFYEFYNSQLGGATRELVYLPRLRVRQEGQVETISKTVGNLQLRDLYLVDCPELWLDRIRNAALSDPTQPLSWANLAPDPIIDLDRVG